MYQIICKITKEELVKYHPLVEKLIEKQPLLKGKNYQKLDAGFTNICYKVEEYIIRICTASENEENFEKEMAFYLKNKKNPYIPKCYIVDKSKKKIPYEYEIIEYIEGKTLYEIWYRLSEMEREKILIKVVEAIKSIHRIEVEPFDFKEYLKKEISQLLKDNRLNGQLFQKLLDSCNQYFEENHFGLIHGDLHFDNLIYKNDRIYIIDFERIMAFPIDYEFKILNRCRYSAWRWASEKTDMLTVEDDYQKVIATIIENYKELKNIKYLKERLVIYQIIDELKEYKDHKNQETLRNIEKNIEELHF